MSEPLRVAAGPGVFAAIVALALALAGCGGDEEATRSAAAGDATTEEALPAPTGVRGSVTGMPDDPGDGTISLGGEAATAPDAPGAPALGDAPVADGADAVATGGAVGQSSVTGTPAGPGAATPGSPGTDAAAGVIRDYYQALNAGQFDRARSLWADGGGASGQSPAQFAGGFADTAAMDVRVIVPDRVDTSTGVAYVDVPVRVTATARDGTKREYAGRYTLRAEGDAWRIASTALGESPP